MYISYIYIYTYISGFRGSGARPLQSYQRISRTPSSLDGQIFCETT